MTLFWDAYQFYKLEIRSALNEEAVYVGLNEWILRGLDDQILPVSFCESSATTNDGTCDLAYDGEDTYVALTKVDPYIVFDMGSPVMVRNYEILPIPNGNSQISNPASWVLFGQNENSDWMETDYQDQVTDWTAAAEDSFPSGSTILVDFIFP